MNVAFCPLCSHRTMVVDSRDRPEGLRRRRECPGCGHRYNTVEIAMGAFTMMEQLKQAATALADILDDQ